LAASQLLLFLKPFPEETALQLMQELGLEEEFMQREAGLLSVGEQQRVCLIRALLAEPDILLLDEPTSSLDERARVLVEKLILSLAREKKISALIVTHSISQAKSWCDRQIDLTEFYLSNNSCSEDKISAEEQEIA
ncbi:ATP-binding cassette domain-containing protein, partial [Candidatus Riflebacteria bacterium]